MTTKRRDKLAEAFYDKEFKQCFEDCWEPSDLELCKDYVIESYKAGYDQGRADAVEEVVELLQAEHGKINPEQYPEACQDLEIYMDKIKSLKEK